MGIDTESEDLTERIRKRRAQRAREQAAAEGRSVDRPVETTAIRRPPLTTKGTAGR